jgi:hypothetical protein
MIDSLGAISGDGTPITAPSFVLGDSYTMMGSTAGPHSPKPHKETLLTFWIDLVGDPASESVPPATGTWIINETPSPPTDDATVIFFTRWPFIDNSLQVWVDNTEQTSSILSVDGIAGTFTLRFAPTSTERLKVRYQSR